MSVKDFIKGVWLFCAYLFWPQKRPKDYYKICGVW